MLIDALSIHYSGSVANTVVPAPDQAKFIHAFKGLLVSVGWTLTDSIFAVGSVTFLSAPVSNGVTHLPKLVVGCPGAPGFLSIGSLTYSLYDPFTEVPAAGIACVMVAMDLTPGGTLDALASAVSTTGSPFDAVVTQLSPSLFRMDLTAKIAGPDYNDIATAGSGAYVLGSGRTYGGGYQLQSHVGASVYQVAVTMADSTALLGNLQFDFTLNGHHTIMQLLDASQGTSGDLGFLGVGGVAQYTIVANPFGFCVFDEPNDRTGIMFRTVSLFAMAPYIPGTEVPPSEHFVTPYAVFLVGPTHIGGPPAWVDYSVMCLDGAPFNNFGDNPTARLLAYRSPGPPLLTPHGVPITIGCYVMFGTDTNSAAWIVGKLWDCALVSDYVAAGGMIQERAFFSLGYSDGTSALTQCTLMMAAGKAIVPEPTVPPPPPPDPPKKGTVNLFGDGVTWLSGDLFDAGMVGHAITINGESYIVLSITDSTHITLTTAVRIAAGATYTTP